MIAIYAYMMCLVATGACHNVYGDLTFKTAAECRAFGREIPSNRDQRFGCMVLTVPAWRPVNDEPSPCAASSSWMSDPTGQCGAPTLSPSQYDH